MALRRDMEGKALYRDGSIRDITERKQAEELLRRQEETGPRRLDLYAAICRAMRFNRVRHLALQPIGRWMALRMGISSMVP